MYDRNETSVDSFFSSSYCCCCWWCNVCLCVICCSCYSFLHCCPFLQFSLMHTFLQLRISGYIEKRQFDVKRVKDLIMHGITALVLFVHCMYVLYLVCFFFIFHSGSFTFKSHWTQLTRYMANSIFIFQWNVLPKRYMHFIGCNFHHSLFYLFFSVCFVVVFLSLLCASCAPRNTRFPSSEHHHRSNPQPTGYVLHTYINLTTHVFKSKILWAPLFHIFSVLPNSDLFSFISFPLYFPSLSYAIYIPMFALHRLHCALWK